MEKFPTRDSGHIFIAQATISLLFIATQFTIKMALKTRVIGAIEWFAYFDHAPLLEPVWLLI